MRLPFLAASLVALLASPIAAQSWVAFLHTPPEVQHADVDLVLAGGVIGAGPGDRLLVRYRRTGDREWRQVPIAPGYGDTYQALIPAEHVGQPSIEYYVEVVDPAGRGQPIFASAEQPQRVRVIRGDGTARVERRPDPPRPDPPKPDPREPDRKREPEGRRPEPTRDPITTIPGSGEGSSDLADEIALFAAEDPVTLATLKAQSVAQAPAIISVISDDQMQAMGAITLVDVLKRIPGLETSRDVQGFWRVAVRGIRTDPEILLLFDGHRMGNLYDGRNLYELPVESIQRVEVIRGPGSALYGTGAFLTVVNVVPSNAEGLTLAASSSAGRGEAATGEDASGFQTAVGHAGYGLRLDNGFLRVDADLESGPGYRMPIHEDAYYYDEDGNAGETRDGRLLAHGAARGIHAIGEGEVTWSLRALHQDRDALIGAFDTVGPNSRLQWTLALADLGWQQPLFGGKVNARLSADVQDVARRFQLTPAGHPDDSTTEVVEFADGAIESVRHASRSLGFDLTGVFDLFEGNTLTLGGSASHQALTGYEYAVNFDPASLLEKSAVEPLATPEAEDPGLTQRLVFGVFAQDAWTVLRGLDITAGLRADVFSGGVGRSDPGAPVGTQGFEFALNPRLGVVWQASEDWSFKALYATAFRVPTFEELTSEIVSGEFTRGRYVGNSELDPVRIRTTELAAEHAFPSGDNHVRLRLNGFLNEFEGRIEAVDLTGNVTPLYNREGATRVWGLEGEGRIDFSPRDRITVGGAWFRAIDTEAPDGRDLLTDVPQLRLIVQAQTGLGAHFDVYLSAMFGAERRNNARSSLEALRRFRIGAYSLVDVTLRTRPIAESVTFALTIQNVLDHPYADDVQRPDRITGLLPGPGLSGRLTARLAF